MSKNIETCKSEEVLSSVLDQQPQDYPSVQQAVHDLGVTALPAASAADPDIAELPSNVEVFVRRVLKAVVYDRVLPVVQQMWQAVLNRILPPNYLPDSLLPYASNPSLRTLGTLPTALSALSVRKISNGAATDDGIKDGVSMARLICDTTATNAVLELKDDNYGYTINMSRLKTLMDMLTNVVTATINGTGQLTCHVVNNAYVGTIYNRAKLETLNMPEVTSANTPSAGSDDTTLPACIMSNPKLATINAPKIDTCNIYGNGSQFSAFISNCPALKEATLGKVRNSNQASNSGWGGTKHIIQYCTALERISVMDLDVNNCLVRSGQNANLIYLQIRGIQANSCNLSWWNPTDKTATFLQNFRDHIAERLAVGPTTNRLTLTLSADVYSACGFGATIDDPTDIRYQIKKAIQDRNWKVTDGTNNFNQ